MNFYFDESGNFQVLNDPRKHVVGIVSGIVIPDSQLAEVFGAMDRFVAALPASAFVNGEPKGSKLDDKATAALADMLFDLPRDKARHPCFAGWRRRRQSHGNRTYPGRPRLRRMDFARRTCQW